MPYFCASFTSSACLRRPILAPAQRPVLWFLVGRKGLGGSFRSAWRAGVGVAGEGSVSDPSAAVADSVPAGEPVESDGGDGVVVEDIRIGCPRALRYDLLSRVLVPSDRVTAASFASLRVRGIVMPVNLAE